MGQIIGLQHKFYGVLRDYYINENNKMNPDALTDSVLSGINPIMRHIGVKPFYIIIVVLVFLELKNIF